MKTIKLIIITICIAMLCACSSSDDNGGGGTSNAVTAVGGTGANGSGGEGGYFYVESDAAIKVLRSGSADPSFTMPAESSYELGDYGYTVSGSESIILDADAPANYAGLYMSSGAWNLYKADGTGSAGSPILDYTVTGLRVPAGATLTINADNNWYGGSYLGAYLEFANDVVIDGTLKTGTGYNYIYFDNADSYSNNIIVTGTVTTSGADEGWVEFDAGRHFYNSGTIDTSGGDNATGNGYESDGIYIYAYTGSVYSKGTLKANGGNAGGTIGGNGGDADYIYLYGGYNEDSSVDPINGGSVIVSGTIEAKGGNAGGTTGGDGGGWGYSDFESYGGDMIVNASFNFSGGNASGSGYTGGEPYGAEFYCYGENYRRVGVCQISGSFNVNGGNGDNGGDAGYVQAFSYSVGHESDGNYLGQAPDVELLGLANINVNGGNGTTHGGNADSSLAYTLYAWAPYSEYEGEYLPAYPIISEANVTAKGGNASATGGIGGTGGYVEIATDYDDENTTSITTVTQSGTIDNSGGNATASGGIGGNSHDIYLGSDNSGYCWNVTTTGKLISKGGNGALQGGDGGYINLYSDEVATVYTLANLSVTGGTGTTAGSEGSAYVDGNQVLPLP